MAYGFAEIEDALARIHGVVDSKRPAFVSRLQHLQKRKFPPGLNTGRGRAASYQAHHLFLLAIMLELNQFGISPEKGEILIANGKGELALGVMRITDLSRGADDDPLFCDVPAWHLDSLGPEKLFGRGLSVFPLKHMSARLAGYGNRDALVRFSIFSLSGLVKILPRAIVPEGEARVQFLQSLREWAVGEAAEWDGYIQREKDLAVLRMMEEEGDPNTAKFAEAAGLKQEWEVIVRESNGNDP